MSLLCEYFYTTKGRSHHERRFCTRRLSQNVINGHGNADFDIIAYEGCILNEEENNTHIVNEDDICSHAIVILKNVSIQIVFIKVQISNLLLQLCLLTQMMNF